jgi:hypothetical protein
MPPIFLRFSSLVGSAEFGSLKCMLNAKLRDNRLVVVLLESLRVWLVLIGRGLPIRMVFRIFYTSTSIENKSCVMWAACTTRRVYS